jgi:hypothetical protein
MKIPAKLHGADLFFLFFWPFPKTLYLCRHYNYMFMKRYAVFGKDTALSLKKRGDRLAGGGGVS